MLPILLHMYGLPSAKPSNLTLHPHHPTIFDMVYNPTSLKPSLPHDVLRLIIEYAAISNRRTAVRLALVSRVAQHWVELILYSVVNLYRESTSRAFLRTIETSRTKSRTFFATHVKSLCISYDVHNERTARIISACRGVTSLTFWVAPMDEWRVSKSIPCNDIASALDHLRPVKLSVLLHGLLQSPYPRFQLSFFEKITHLSVINTWDDWATWNGFELLPSLTHLSFDVHVGPRTFDNHTTLLISHVINNILVRCPRLRVCILLLIFDPHPSFTASTILSGMATLDPRLVFLGDSEPFLDREAHSRREENIWKLAERVVTRQRLCADHLVLDI